MVGSGVGLGRVDALGEGVAVGVGLRGALGVGDTLGLVAPDGPPDSLGVQPVTAAAASPAEVRRKVRREVITSHCGPIGINGGVHGQGRPTGIVTRQVVSPPRHRVLTWEMWP